MNKVWKNIILAGAVGAAALSLTGCAVSMDKDTVVATMDGSTEVTLGEAMVWLRYNQMGTESVMSMWMGTTDFWDQDLWGSGEAYSVTFKENIMSDIKEMLILEQHMSEYDVELTDEDKEAIQTATSEFLAANDEKALEAMYADENTVNRVLTLYTIRQKMTTAIEAGADTEVSDEEAAQKKVEYALFSTADTTDDDGNTVELTDEEKEAVKQQAQDVIDAVNGGSTLADAVTAVDEDLSTSTDTYGGEETLSVTEIQTAAETLSDGEIYAEPVETDSGYYVVQMVSTFDEEATETEKEHIISDRQQELYDETLEGWEPDSFDINNKVWNAISFNVSFTAPTEAETETESGSETATEAESGSEAATEAATEAESASEADSSEAGTDETETEAASEAATEAESES